MAHTTQARCPPTSLLPWAGAELLPGAEAPAPRPAHRARSLQGSLPSTRPLRHSTQPQPGHRRLWHSGLGALIAPSSGAQALPPLSTPSLGARRRRVAETQMLPLAWQQTGQRVSRGPRSQPGAHGGASGRPQTLSANMFPWGQSLTLSNTLKVKTRDHGCGVAEGGALAWQGDPQAPKDRKL